VRYEGAIASAWFSRNAASDIVATIYAPLASLRVPAARRGSTTPSRPAIRFIVSSNNAP
jgi:hypothetical protein